MGADSRVLSMVAWLAIDLVRCLLACAGRFVADLPAVAPGIGAQRMRERRRAVDLGVLNVVDGGPFGRIQACGVANALRDLMVGTRGIAAHAQAADARLPAVKR